MMKLFWLRKVIITSVKKSHNLKFKLNNNFIQSRTFLGYINVCSMVVELRCEVYNYIPWLFAAHLLFTSHRGFVKFCLNLFFSLKSRRRWRIWCPK